jgi:hypothetical protein
MITKEKESNKIYQGMSQKPSLPVESDEDH